MISDGGLLSDCAFKKHPHLKAYQMRVVSEFIVTFLSISWYCIDYNIARNLCRNVFRWFFVIWIWLILWRTIIVSDICCIELSFLLGFQKLLVFLTIIVNLFE